MIEDLFVCGDIHGELETLVFNAVEKKKLKNVGIIVVGDFGAGFGNPKSMDVKYEKVLKRLERNNLKIYTVRGNHDDPSFFDGKHDYDRLEFLQDHTITEICGWKIYPIGGAVSQDIDFKSSMTAKTRREINEKLIKVRSSRRVWWPDEGIVQKRKGLPIKVDMIISHAAPLTFQPIAERPNYVSKELWDSILEERRYLDFVLDSVLAKRWFYGHYHINASGSRGDLLHRCLPPHELFKVYQ